MAEATANIFQKAKILIDEKGLKKTFIAEKLGISLPSLSLKLKGERPFKVAELENLAEILNCKITKFF